MAKNKTVKSIGWWFVVSCVANSLWVMAWLYEFTFVSILIMIIMLVSLLKIIMNTRTDMNKPGWAPVVFLRLPFAIYAGWITVALIADVAAYLTKIGWDGFGISETLWTIIMFAVAVLVHLFMIWKRGMPDFAASAGWALIAIAVANKDVNNTVYLAAIVAAAILLVNGIIRLLQRPILQYH